MELIDLQKQFMAGLDLKSPAILGSVSASSPEVAALRFAIYQNSVLGTKQKALRNLYKICQQLVGEEFFIAMANAYSAQWPSRAVGLAQYGEFFAEFCQDFLPAQSLPYLPDVARLEWAWHCNAHAPLHQSLDMLELAEFSAKFGEKIIFRLSDAAHLLSSAYPLHTIWEVHQPHYVGDKTIILPKDTQFYYLVYQHFFAVHIEVLDEIEWHFLQWVQLQLSLGEISERSLDYFPEKDINLALARAIQRGWLVGVNI